jgi:hypothetical protein
MIPETESGAIKKPAVKPSGTIARRPPTRPTKKQVKAAFDFFKP